MKESEKLLISQLCRLYEKYGALAEAQDKQYQRLGININEELNQTAEEARRLKKELGL